MSVTDDQATHQHHFFRGATVIAGLTLLSRVFGLVRDSAISAMGATHVMGTFRVAFSIPNLFRRLFGEGAMATAFIPVFAKVEAEGDSTRPRAVLANAAGLLAVLLAAIVVLGELALLTWVMLTDGSDSAALLPKLVMIVLPFMFTVCLLALGSAALNCRRHFIYPAFAPILLNVFMIAAALGAHRFFSGATSGGLYLLAGSVTLAGFVQLAGVIWMLRRLDLAAMPRIRPVLAPVKRMARLALPMIVPSGILQFSAFFDRIYAHALASRPGHETLELLGFSFTKPLGQGVVTWFDNANRLYQFPMAIFGISLATAMYPLFSRYSADGDTAGLRSATNRALRLSLMLGLPSAAGLIVLSEPVIAAIFRHGLFTTGDVVRTAFMLRLYCLGMCAYFCNHILLRAFFAQQDTRTPLRTSCILAGANLLIMAPLVFSPLGEGAIPLATAITATVNSLVLVYILRRRWGRLGLTSVLISLVKILIATAAMAAALLGIRHYMLGTIQDATNTRVVVALLTAVPVGAAVFIGTAWALRSRELSELRSTLRKKSKLRIDE